MKKIVKFSVSTRSVCLGECESKFLYHWKSITKNFKKYSKFSVAKTKFNSLKKQTGQTEKKFTVTRCLSLPSVNIVDFASLLLICMRWINKSSFSFLN